MSALPWLAAIILLAVGTIIICRKPKKKEPNRGGIPLDQLDFPGLNSIKEGKCPDCGYDDFYEGPSGGISTNIKCANELCGSKFNVAQVDGQFLLIERI